MSIGVFAHAILVFWFMCRVYKLVELSRLLEHFYNNTKRD